MPKKDKDKAALRAKHLMEFNSITLDELKMLRDFLEPLKTASDELEASKTPTLHLVHPWYRTIREHFQPKPLDPAMISRMKTVGLVYWTENVQTHITSYHDVAVVLHPEMKELRLYDDLRQEMVWKKVEELMNNFSPRTEPRVEAISRATQPKQRNISKAMQCFIGNRTDAATPQPNELEEYRQLILREDVDSLLDWWEENKLRFPRLYGVARLIHGIPASSAAAERLFSKAGRIVTFRPHMRSTLVDELLFLQSNIDMFNKLKSFDEEESNAPTSDSELEFEENEEFDDEHSSEISDPEN